MAPTASAAPHRSAEKPLQAMQDLASQDSEFTTQARHSLILCICNVVLSLSVSRCLFVDSRASGSAFQERVLHRAFSVALGKSKSKHTQMPVTLKFKKGCCVEVIQLTGSCSKQTCHQTSQMAVKGLLSYPSIYTCQIPLNFAD